MNVPLVLLSSCHLIIVPKWPYCLVSLKASLSGFIPHVPFFCITKNAACSAGLFLWHFAAMLWADFYNFL